MKPLNKRLPREFKNNLGKYLGIFFLMTFTCAFVSGFLGAAASLRDLCDAMRNRYNVEDFYFTTMYEMKPADVSAVEDLGCRVYENFSRDIPLEVEGSDRDISARIFRIRDGAFNAAVYAEGTAPQAQNEVALDRVFCQNNNLGVGSTVALRDEEFTISGIMTLADYTVDYKTSGDFMFNSVTFGVTQLGDEDFERLAGEGMTYTYAVLLNDRNLDIADRVDIEEEMVDILVDRDVVVTNLVDADSNIGIIFASEDVDGDSAMWTVLMFILICIMSFVFVVLTDASIEQESAVIGTLLASGYRKRELVAHYMVLPILVGLVSVTIGNAIGVTWLVQPMKDLYYNSYNLPPFEYQWHWEVFLVTSVIPFVSLVVISFFGLVRKLGATPLQFLRHETGGRTHIGGIGLPERLPYPTRFRLRVFLRNASHFATLFAGIAFGSMLLLLGLCMLPIVTYNAELMAADVPAEHLYTLKAQLVLDATDDERTAWAAAEELATDPAFDSVDLDRLKDLADRLEDLGIDTSDTADLSGVDLTRIAEVQQTLEELDDELADLSDENRERLEGLLEDLGRVDNLGDDPINQTAIPASTLDQVERYAVASFEVKRSLSDTYEEVAVYGIEENSAYWTDYDVSSGAIVVGSGLIDKCDAKLGEELTLIDRYTNSTYTITPTNSGGHETNTSIYMSRATFNSIFENDDDYFCGYISNEELPLDERYVASELTPDIMLSVADQMQDSMGFFMNMLTAMVVPVYLVLIYLLTKTVIDRSARSISYMKVFGYHDHEIDGLYVRAITVTVVASLVLCIPLVQAFVTWIVPILMARYSGNFAVVYPPHMMAEIVGIGFVTYVVVAVLHLFRIRRVPLILAMKVQE